MAIDLQSLSITSAFNSIVNYFRSQENNSTWRDFSNSSEGSFICRLLANVMSVISYRIIAQSRENYLSTAALPASNIGIAVNLGYSVPRGSNLKRLIRLTPNGNYTLPKFSVIGSYNTEYSIINLNEETLVEGVPMNIETVVGNLREESFITGTSDTKIFSLFNANISDDFILFKDNIEVHTTTTLKGMLDNKYLVRTNPYSSVDIAFFNTLETADPNYKYGNGSEITIRYVELANVPVIPYSNNMFTYGTLDDYRTIQGNRGMETVDSIKVTAPLYHEVQNLIRSKADYASALRIDVNSVNEVNYKALTPTYTQITYLKDNFSLLTGTYQEVGSSQQNQEALQATEVGTFIELLKNQNYFGTPLPDIVVPKREEAYLHIGVALKNKYKNVSDVNADIDNILKNYYNTYLNVNFNTYELERKIENLSYVKYARVEHVINDRNPNSYCQLGYITYDPDSKGYYKISNMLASTSSTLNFQLPWKNGITVGDAIDTNAIFRDGSIYWKCYKKLPNVPMRKRFPSTTYALGEFVHTGTDNPGLENFMFKCVDLVRYSGTVTPDTTLSELGDFIEDGGVVWVVIDRISDPTISEWQASKQYRIGQRVNGVGDNFSLECVSYAGRCSSTTKPLFFQDTLPVESAVVDTGKLKVTVSGNYAQYFKKDDVINMEYSTSNMGSKEVYFIVDQNASYSVSTGFTTILLASYQGSSITTDDRTYTYIYPVERATVDGDLAWELVDNPQNIQYGWNSYVAFKHEVEILED